jgi:hypothetical protein
MPDLEIRQEIARYIESQIDAQTLEDRLHDHAWDSGDVGSELVADVLRLLAERANGDWTDVELRDRLAGLNRNYWFLIAPKNIVPDSTATVIAHGQRAVESDRRLVAGSA